MKLGTFIGGIHPNDFKQYTKALPIVEQKASMEVVFPLSQHIGKPAKAIVKAGDKVLRGQMIAEKDGFVSANIFSSVSGTVKIIEPRMTVGGSRAVGIVISNDGKNECVKGFDEPQDYKNLTKDELLKKIDYAGIVGLGGAGFPTSVKLMPKDPDAIEYIIINGAECEPYLTSDYRLMLEKGEQIVEGAKIILSLFKNAKLIIGIEDNKPEAVEKMRKLTSSDDKITIKELKTKYPQGGERTLIYATTGRKIYSEMLPSDVGCIVDNVASTYAVYQAVVMNHPLVDKIISVSGNGINKPCNLLVPLGTYYADIVETAGGLKSETTEIISGGPMMGMAMFDLNVPVSKTASTLLCLEDKTAEKQVHTACINCGKCVEVCPGRIVPKLAYKYAVNNDMDNFVKVNGMECCECGCCSYVCPAKQDMVQAMKTMRQKVMAERRRKKASVNG